ncbi:hypothetical protein BBBOND_0209630 [Babesia bigemina]|uniref:Uncharacterized protein n=1 Tax=Babesia bigemina TaxID=5866 RepID=A0A061DCY3_BABBI|nr:hypothetical protein BBBOND_0209630 [Babesia bigemina]CDR95810.1 hypothetical protein BBBOND_0209630 [Babesia bigemina]|eukprot:XP_012767996.1 hypothetical protein BBBOND_0209630 [Babesia bigemina]
MVDEQRILRTLAGGWSLLSETLKSYGERVWHILILKSCPLCKVGSYGNGDRTSKTCELGCVYFVSLFLSMMIGLIYYVAKHPIFFLKGIFCCFF